MADRQNGTTSPADGPEDYYNLKIDKRSVTIPFLDHLLNELDTRFSCLHERVAVGTSLVPSAMSSRPSTKEFSCFQWWLAAPWCPPCWATPVLRTLGGCIWKPDNLTDTMKQCDGKYFLLRRQSSGCVVLSLSLVQSVRGAWVSCVSLKTYLRSSKGQTHFTSLAPMYVHRFDWPCTSSGRICWETVSEDSATKHHERARELYCVSSEIAVLLTLKQKLGCFCYFNFFLLFNLLFVMLLLYCTEQFLLYERLKIPARHIGNHIQYLIFFHWLRDCVQWK